MTLSARMRNPFAPLGVRQQLLASFGMLIFLSCLLGGASLFGLSRVSAEAQTLAGKWLNGLGMLADARAHLIAAREFEVKYSKTEDKSYHSEYREKIDEAATALQGLLGRYAAKAQAEDEKALVTHMDKVWLQYRQSQQRVIELGRKSQLDAADIADGASSMLFDEAIASVNALIKFNQDPGFERGGGSRTRR